jgi:hypothetical protein
VLGDWAGDDQPLDCGWAAVNVNNAEHLCEEGNLRTLFEYGALYSDLFGSTGTTGDADTFPWGSPPWDGGENGCLVLCTQRVRLRAHGSTGRYPSVEWRWRWSSGLDGGAPVTISALAVVVPGRRRPQRGDPSATTSVPMTTSTSVPVACAYDSCQSRPA